MSKYTTEVRFICENAAGYDESKGYSDVDSIIDAAIPSVFSFDFPIYDDAYRNVICTKILRHYYTREIGFETVGLWKLKLQTKLNEIMPYYNQLYNSALIKFNPLYDTDLHTTHVGDKNGQNIKEENKNGLSSSVGSKNEIVNTDKNGSIIEGEKKKGENVSDNLAQGVSNTKNDRDGSNSETGRNDGTKASAEKYSESESKLHYDLYSDTPQGALTGVDDEEYLTNARKVTDSNSKNGNNGKTDVENSNYNKSGSFDENDSSESTAVSQENTKSEYEEENNKNTLNNEQIRNRAEGGDNRVNNSYETLNGTDKYNSTESYIMHVVGKQSGASFSKLLKEFRETFLNIDMDIIRDLNDLFMNLW